MEKKEVSKDEFSEVEEFDVDEAFDGLESTKKDN